MESHITIKKKYVVLNSSNDVDVMKLASKLNELIKEKKEITGLDFLKMSWIDISQILIDSETNN